MSEIAFTKAHAAGNDFLIVEASQLAEGSVPEHEFPPFARRLCDRHEGVGADGVEIIAASDSTESDYFIRIFNSDGSEAEISGNGTRCVAAELVDRALVDDSLRLETIAGVKHLTLLGREGRRYDFQMNMGRPAHEKDDLRTVLDVAAQHIPVTILNVGNPQCALFVDDFEFDWRGVGREIERHKRFPKHTNVSFIHVLDKNTIDVRFWERGAGETSSSGTGATGAAAAAILHKKVQSPVRVMTAAGELNVEWSGDDADALLTGPAVLVARGIFMC